MKTLTRNVEAPPKTAESSGGKLHTMKAKPTTSTRVMRKRSVDRGKFGSGMEPRKDELTRHAIDPLSFRHRSSIPMRRIFQSAVERGLNRRRYFGYGDF